MSLKIIFAGSPEFAVYALKALIDSPHEIVAVYTQPDKPAGRGLKLTPSPVKVVAQAHQLPVYEPASLKSELEQDTLKQLKADVMVVAAYGKLLPSVVLHAPRHGCINIHPSLLPRWRGAAPIQRTLHEGDKQTGVTIMRMDEGLDTGPILLQREYAIPDKETSKTLHDALAVLGAEALLEALTLLEQGKLTETPQQNDQATYAHKISKEEALIDWMQTADVIKNMVRAFNPWPVAHTSWQGESLRIWDVDVLPNEKKVEPRTILHASKDGIDIATADGSIRLLEVQLPGGKVMSARDFYNAKHDLIIPGQHFI